MATGTADKPGIEETYSGAVTSSNLRMEVREDSPNGAASVLIAVGWSPSRLGAALMRLHTGPDRAGLEKVHEQLVIQAKQWGVERPEAVSASVLSWWLQRVCVGCSGVRFEVIPGTPHLSSRPCRLCKATGESKLHYGEVGRRMAAWLDDCKQQAVQSIKRRLRPN